MSPFTRDSHGRVRWRTRVLGRRQLNQLSQAGGSTRQRRPSFSARVGQWASRWAFADEKNRHTWTRCCSPSPCRSPRGSLRGCPRGRPTRRRRSWRRGCPPFGRQSAEGRRKAERKIIIWFPQRITNNGTHPEPPREVVEGGLQLRNKYYKCASAIFLFSLLSFEFGKGTWFFDMLLVCAFEAEQVWGCLFSHGTFSLQHLLPVSFESKRNQTCSIMVCPSRPPSLFKVRARLQFGGAGGGLRCGASRGYIIACAAIHNSTHAAAGVRNAVHGGGAEYHPGASFIGWRAKCLDWVGLFVSVPQSVSHLAFSLPSSPRRSRGAFCRGNSF